MKNSEPIINPDLKNVIRLDLIFAIIFFIFGSLPVILLLKDNNYYTFFYQFFIPESISWACGKNFVLPVAPIAEFGKFATGSLLVFDCSLLSQVDFLDQAGFYYRVQPYLTWIVAICWRLFGVSYISLLPIIYVLYGAYIAGVYLLCRQFLGYLFSAVISLFIAISPISAYMAIELRDFSKAPFFIWALLFLMKSIRCENNSLRILYALFASCIVALGYGFRSDLIVLVPFGLIFLAACNLGRILRNRKPRKYSQLYVLPTYIITFVIAAYPIWSNINFSGYSGTFVMQGMSEPFRIEANISTANYATGWQYSDELTLSSVAAALSMKDEKWDEKEGDNVAGINTTNAFQKSTKYMLSWADIFIGDFFTQGIKSGGWIINFPGFISRNHPHPSLTWKDAVSESWAAKITLRIYSALAGEWFLWVGIIGFFSLIYQSFLRSPEEAIGLIVLFVMVLSYPGVQFSLRHVFHLEFFWILCLFSLITVIPIIARDRSKFISVLTTFLLSGCLITLGYFLAITYQDKTLSFEIKRIMSLPRVSIDTVKEFKEDGDIFLRVPVPNQYKKYVFGKEDSMTPSMYLRGVQWDVRAAADRLLIRINNDECKAEDIHLYGRYRHTNNTWQPLDIKMLFSGVQAGSSNVILFPAFYRGTQYFDGLLIPREYINCNIVVEKIIGESRVPLFLTANIRSDTIIGPLHKKIGNFGIDLNDVSITESDKHH